MKGIILAGGKGTRLFPATKAVNKQMLPVYDKPMIYYPLSILMMAEIRDILIISSPEHLPDFKELLGDGKDIGMNFTYAEQAEPKGIAEAFLIGEDFIGNDSVALILGDNIFYGDAIQGRLLEALDKNKGATTFACYVKDPERYGVVNFSNDGVPIALEEKPQNPSSNWAVTGLYFYDNQVIDIAKTLQASDRGELEITDVNKIYLERGELQVHCWGRGFAWLDAGTNESLLESSEFIHVLEKRQGLKIASIEEIAYRKNYISLSDFGSLVEGLPPCSYKEDLMGILKDERAYESQEGCQVQAQAS